MSSKNFEKLSMLLPKIAELVNAFESETVQRDVFHVLLATFENRPIKRPAGIRPSSRDSSVIFDDFSSEITKKGDSGKRKREAPASSTVNVETDLTEGGSIHSFIESS